MFTSICQQFSWLLSACFLNELWKQILFSKKLFNFFVERKNFSYYLTILVLGVRQSFEWICKTGSHKQRSVSCPSTWGQPSHMGEWLQNCMLFAALQKWSDLNFGLDQQNYPFCGLCAGKINHDPRPSFLPVMEEWRDHGPDPLGLFLAATCITWLLPQPWEEIDLGSGLYHLSNWWPGDRS